MMTAQPGTSSRGAGSEALDGTRRSIVPLALAILVSIPLIACTSSSGNGEGGNGGVLRIGTSSGIDALNPFVGFNQDAFSTWMYIYPSLLQYDTTSTTYDYLPNFAQTWKQSPDGL